MPEHALVVGGGTLLDDSGERPADVGIDADGMIAEIGAGLTGQQTLDAEGATIIPGLVDLHAHLGQPGFEESETIESASRAAALGGYTAVVAMPDTNPAIDNAAMVREVQLLAAKAMCQIEIAGALTVGRQGEQLAPIAEMAKLGVRLFTDVSGVQDSRVMRRILEYASAFDVVVAQFANDESLAAGGHLHEGAVSSRLGIAGVPAAAEEVMVGRDLTLARLAGARLHFMHLTTQRSVEAVAAARADGVDVTCDVTPHHLALTDGACSGFDPAFKVEPPLRPETDRDALRHAAIDGSIDAIATDHLPCAPQTKEHPFDLARPGMLGLEHALGSVLSQPGLDLRAIVQLMSVRPAEIAGITASQGGTIAAGRPANLAVIDLGEEWTVDATALASLSRNTPCNGQTFTGRVRHTICNGEAVVIDKEPTR